MLSFIKGVLKVEGFIEQVVKRQNKAKQLYIKIIAVFLLFAVPISCTLLAYVITAYLVYIGLFLFIIGVYAVWYVFSSQKVEYEYSIVGDELVVAKVIALRRRKTMCKVPIREIEKLGKGEKTVENVRFTKVFEAAGDIDAVEENYYCAYNSPAYGKSELIFAPNEKILQAMKPYLHKDLVIKLFYNRNVG